MINEEFYIPCDGIQLHIKLDLPDHDPRTDHSRIPMVLVIPGLTGHMEEPHMVAIAEALAGAGFASLRAELYGAKPVLVAHSPTDELVPYECGLRMAEAYQNAEMFTTGEDDHCFATHIDQVTGKMISFINSISKSPDRYRYLLFDLDGTLTDPKEGITKSVQHALRR